VADLVAFAPLLPPLMELVGVLAGGETGEIGETRTEAVPLVMGVLVGGTAVG